MNGNKWMTARGSLTEQTERLYNPGCGWYEIHSFWIENEVSKQEILACMNPRNRLVFVRIHLGAYREIPLDESAITHMEQILHVMEQERKDVILRCCYDFEGRGMEKEPMYYSQVVTHMKQIAEVIRQFEQMIYLYQGILIGSWGEMHTSKFLAPEQINELLGIAEEGTHNRIWHGVRRPAFLNPLSEQMPNIREIEMQKRTIFDDGIFGSPTHLGTFQNEEEIRFLEALGEVAPYGGEVISGEIAMKWTWEETVNQMKRLHVSYLNEKHDNRILQHWKQQRVHTADLWDGMDGLEYIGRHLGYRFLIRKIREQKNFFTSRTVRLVLEIENIGFSDIYEEVELFVIHKRQDGTVMKNMCLSGKRFCASGKKRDVAIAISRRKGAYYVALQRKKDHCPIYFANPRESNGWVPIGIIE